MPALKLKILPGRLAVCRLEAEAALPGDLFTQPFFSLTRSGEELSLVLPEDRAPVGAKVEPGWRALQVEGPLDFSLTGILAGLAAPLARAQVSLFAISTYDTDILLVRADDLAKAVRILEENGYIIVA
jgi:uncharacterized protein